MEKIFPSNWGIKFSWSSERGDRTKSGSDGLGTELIGHSGGDGIAEGRREA